MSHGLNEVLLRPGDFVKFEDRDDLLETLDRLEQHVPARHEGRNKLHREHFCMLRYLRRLAGEDLLSLPLTLMKPPEGQDPPDFKLEFDNGQVETFELTDGSTVEYQRKLSTSSKNRDHLVLPVDINMPTEEAAQLWADTLFSAFREKAEGLMLGRFDLDHLLIYDLTGLNLLLSLEEGAQLLKQKLLEWYTLQKPAHRFSRVSILRDDSLFLDVGGNERFLYREWPYFELPVIRISEGQDLKKQLRDIDRFCRDNSIRQLTPFEPSLGRPIKEFPGESGLGIELSEEDMMAEFKELLVEFEPGVTVTQLDLDRVERRLGELIGFKVTLHKPLS